MTSQYTWVNLNYIQSNQEKAYVNVNEERDASGASMRPIWNENGAQQLLLAHGSAPFLIVASLAAYSILHLIFYSNNILGCCMLLTLQVFFMYCGCA